MSGIGFDSVFYDRLDRFSRSLNRVLLSERGKAGLADPEDWRRTLELVRTLAAQEDHSLAASSVAACLKRGPGSAKTWEAVGRALESRELDQTASERLYALAWSLDEERATVLARMGRDRA